MRTVSRWWKVAGAFVLTAGGYALIDRAASAQPAAPQWMRSSSPLSPAAASSMPLPPSPGAVIPASASLPAAVAQPPLPALPSTPPVPPPAAPMTLDFKAPVAPKVPAAPVLPLTPPTPPAKSAPAVQPQPPAKTDSPLRPGDMGNSVKADAAWKAAPVAAPSPRVVDRPKPPDVPVAPSEREVFVLPKPPAPAPMATPAPVAGPVAPPPPAAVPMPPPSAPAVPVATTPGANPMTFKSTAAAAILGGALMAPAAGAQDTQKDKDAAKATDQKLNDIQKSIDGITEMLKGRKDATGVVLPSDVGLLEEVKRLRDDVALLKTQMEAMKSTSLRTPIGGATPNIPGVPNPMPGVANPLPGAAPAAAAQGTVRVVNEYPVEITMVVNGRTYRVNPSASQDIPVTAGEFSYQLLSASAAAAPTRSTIRAGETVTLRIK